MNNYISGADLSFLEKMLIEASSEEYTQIAENDWMALRIQAQNFIGAYNSLLLQEKQLKSQELRILINNPNSFSYVKNMRGKQETYILRSKYLLAFNFDRYLTNFLGGLPKEAIYVFQESDGSMSSYKLSLIELAKRATLQGRLSITKNQLIKKGLAQERKSIEESSELLNEHIQQVQLAYAAASYRLNRYYDKIGASGSSRQGGLLMWKKNAIWQVGRVLNWGDLKEAYASALMIQHNSSLDKLKGVNPGAPAEYSEAIVDIFYDNYIRNVTNKAAIIEEDLTVGGKQYGIKSDNAEMPSLNQYINTAEWILSLNRPFSKIDIENYFKSAFSEGARNTVLKTIQNSGDKGFNEILDYFVQNLTQ